MSELDRLLGHQLVVAIERLVDERVEARIAEIRPVRTGRRWLTLREAATELNCTPDAVRMRVKRGRLEHRRHGRRLYVSAASVDQLR